MDACCAQGCESTEALRRYGRVLWIVLGINAAMFAVEFAAGLSARSSALLADSLDMFGDASLYAASLYVAGRSARAQAGVALLKGGAMALLGIGVAGQVVWRLWAGGVPEASTMGAVGALALAANITCALLLYRFRGGDLNMRSTWLCSRNDVIANLGVLLAAAGVGWFGSPWPDLIVGTAIAALVLRDAFGVLGDSVRALGPGLGRAA